jgi:hypothetical protein
VTRADDILRAAVRAEMRTRGLGSLLTWCPHIPHPKQLELIEAPEEEVLFGGAAGGGKSDAMLMRLLRYVDVPGYSAIAFRRTHTDLALAGSLMDRSHSWGLKERGAHWDGQNKVWTFPSGAKLTFAYLDNDNDRQRYKSAEFQQIAWDELTQFPSDIGYRFLFSRLRKPERGPLSQVPLQAVAATNPGDAGHSWVMRRFGLDANGRQPERWIWKNEDNEDILVTRTDRRFIRSLATDNPTLDLASYLKQLAKLDSVTQKQQRDGLWIIDGSSLVYKFTRERNTIAALPKRDDWKHIFSIDLGSSDSSKSTSFTDVLWNPHEKVVYVPRSWPEAGLGPSDVADRIEEAQARSKADYGPDAWCYAVMDEGALGKAYGNEFRRRHGMAVRPAKKTEKKGYRRELNGDFEKGRVLLVESECVPLIGELETLIWNDSRTDPKPGLADHCSDGLLYGWRDARAYASEAPDQQPPPGSPEWVDAEAKRLRELEKRRHRERRERAPGDGW